jgi:hypothetical protein
MKQGLVLAAVVAVLIGIAAPAAAVGPVDNDGFADRVTLPAGEYSGDNIDATAEAGEPQHVGSTEARSVWFEYTATRTQRIQVDDCESPESADFDSVIAVYEDGPAPGTAVNDLIPVDDSAGLEHICATQGPDENEGNLAQWDAQEGKTYFIALDSRFGGQGQYVLSIHDDIPVATILSGPEGQTFDRTPTFTFQAPAGVRNYCGIELQSVAVERGLDAFFCSEANSHTPYFPLRPGDYFFGVTAKNEDGLYDVHPAIRAFTIEKDPSAVAPETKIKKGPKKKTAKRKATFKFVANERGAMFGCSLNGADFTPCESPHRVKADKGRNKFQVLALDEDGAIERTPASYSWKYKKGGKGKKGKGGKGKTGKRALQASGSAPLVLQIP